MRWSSASARPSLETDKEKMTMGNPESTVSIDTTIRKATSQPRILQILERLDRTLLEIQLASPTCQQVNILIERLSQANDGLDLIVQNQEAFIAAV